MPADKDLVKRKKARKQLGTACTPTKLTEAGNRNHTVQLEPRCTMRPATFTEIHCFSTGPCCSKQTVQISLPTQTNKIVKPSLPYHTLYRHFGFYLVKLCTMNTQVFCPKFKFLNGPSTIYHAKGIGAITWTVLYSKRDVSCTYHLCVV
jgi:hypothetical protein